MRGNLPRRRTICKLKVWVTSLAGAEKFAPWHAQFAPTVRKLERETRWSELRQRWMQPQSAAMRNDWPNGAEVAVSLTFDVDAECGWLGEDPGYATKLSTLSEASYGPTRGLPRILDILAKHEIKGTFYVPGDTAERHTDSVKRIVDDGHEVGHHGYLHKRSDAIDADEQREEIERGLEALQTPAQRHAERLPLPELGADARDARAPQGARVHVRQQPDGRRSAVRVRRAARDPRALEPRRLAAPALEAGARRRVHGTAGLPGDLAGRVRGRQAGATARHVHDASRGDRPRATGRSSSTNSSRGCQKAQTVWFATHGDVAAFVGR